MRHAARQPAVCLLGRNGPGNKLRHASMDKGLRAASPSLGASGDFPPLPPAPGRDRFHTVAP